jgi:hypothetical protein
VEPHVAHTLRTRQCRRMRDCGGWVPPAPGAPTGGWTVSVLIRADNGHEAYIAVAAAGLVDPTMFALLLTAIPGIGADDWQPERGGVAGFEPGSGEILWSAVIPPSTASALMEDDDGGLTSLD